MKCGGSLTFSPLVIRWGSLKQTHSLLLNFPQPRGHESCPWSLKSSRVYPYKTPAYYSLPPVDCRCSEKCHSCRLDAVLIIGKQNTESNMSWMWRKENLVVKELMCKRIHILVVSFHTRNYSIIYS